MSLSVKDPRSRGKSPGRERSVSRSRDYRAPSPPEIRPKKSSKESSSRPSKKYYSDESESDRDRSRKPVSSKKYYDDDSDSDPRSRAKPAPTKKYYEDDYSDDHGRSGKHSSSRRYDHDYSSDDSRSRKTSGTKKYYESDSDSDRRKPAARTSVAAPAKHEVAEPKHRRASPPDTRAATQLSHKISFDEASGTLRSRRVSPPHSSSIALTRKESFDETADAIKNRRALSTTLDRKDEYSQPSKRHYDERYDERHDPSRASDYLRRGYSHESSGRKSPETKVPGQYKWEYDHDRPTPPVSGPDHDRGISTAASGNFNVGIGSDHSQPHHGYSTAPSHPTQPVAQPQHRPEPQRMQSNSSANTSMYADLTHAVKYAELPQQVSYSTPKIDDRKPTYTQSSQPQFVEMKPQYSTLQPNHTETLGPRMHRLSVSGGVSGGLSLSPGQGHGHMQGGLPPGSPLLEAYHGTYQSISPMPSPLMLPSTMDDDLSDIDTLSRYSSDDSRRGTSHKPILKKRVGFYDAEDDAIALAAALKHTKPDPEPIIRILPRISDENVLELRMEYKKHYKVSGKGINVAKHIKMKVPGNFGKIAYAVALGRWESEAHWANFWYQSNTSRRELLIESLIGRSNSEIAKIKEKFSDKRYNDSLEKCMQTELKKDKFRTAILLALEQRRMEESDKISTDLVRRDVQDLHRALISKEGGETAMINIIVVRSDNHLREVLRSFEATYHKNFAREMIQKSRNLVVSPTPPIINLYLYSCLSA